MIVQYVIRIFVVAFLSLSVGGCSWIFVNGPPPGHEERDFFTCTENRAVPIIDAVFSGLSLLSVLAAEETVDLTQGEQQLYGSIWTVVLGASAYSGFGRVRRCTSAQLDAARRNRATEEAEAAALGARDLAAEPGPWPTPVAPPLRRQKRAGP